MVRQVHYKNMYSSMYISTHRKPFYESLNFFNVYRFHEAVYLVCNPKGVNNDIHVQHVLEL